MTTDLATHPVTPTAASKDGAAYHHEGSDYVNSNTAGDTNSTTETIPSGHFQKIIITSTSATVVDDIYGSHILTEPLLIALLTSPAVRRLGHVAQHGITAHLGHTPFVTRLEHSVGAMILVRAVGGSVEEQAAGLLHDISHTAFSHVADSAFPSPVSYHEEHKDEYVAMTNLRSILAAHGATEQIFDEEEYGLVERPAPHLCADRLDYGLRDAVGFGHISLEQGRAVFAAVRAFPSPHLSDHKRYLVVTDLECAHSLARAYSSADAGVWSNAAHSEIDRRLGEVISRMVARGALVEKDMWLDDAAFLAKLKRNANEQERAEVHSIENDELPVDEGLGIPHDSKIRTIDPDVWVAGTDHAVPLSTIMPEWKQEREEYIARRETERRSPPV